MSETELSLSQHKQAEELHQKILTSYSLVQKNLWDMCVNLKQMRDKKLYKELGYTEFNNYTQKELGMTDRNVYKYISVAENVDPNLVNTYSLNGISKLQLLATISSDEQKEITEKVNLEETTVKELKEKINDLKKRNDHLMTRVSEVEKEALESRKSEAKACGRAGILETDNESYKKKIEQLEQKSKIDDAEKRSLQARLDDTGSAMRSAANEKEALEKENAELRENIKELENCLVEVAVVDNSAEYEEKLKTALEAANQENRQHEVELEAKFRAEEAAIRKKLEEEKQTAISEVRSDYEKKLSESVAATPVDEDKLKFKVYLTSAYDTLNRLTEFTSQHTEPIYKEKIKQLLNSVLTNMEE